MQRVPDVLLAVGTVDNFFLIADDVLSRDDIHFVAGLINVVCGTYFALDLTSDVARADRPLLLEAASLDSAAYKEIIFRSKKSRASSERDIPLLSGLLSLYHE